ncbi:putative ATP-dependent DNA ligase YkoU [Luteitalea pratensis]|uniref:DNA ligase (ATP) n=1 Tax=Luteitalea pratensis TaxID=1855912 RepID=A0A143PFN9_LUTPR|nr:ATP-dependent DNA ligase [Luteitalea pratensis]AMY07236.1 putative ATP-dependent DNA ligase YkoU [Luteitalea pratensis]
MQRFSALYATLDRTLSTNAKVAALEAYFREAPPQDAAWTVFFLAGRRLLRLLPTKLLREWTQDTTGIAPWLLHESYAAVGDFAETLALLLDGVPAEGDERTVPLHVWIEERLEGLRAKPPDAQREDVVRWWRALPSFERYLLNKLLTGEMRVGVSQTLVVRALAAVAGVGTDVMTLRLMGQWSPSAQAFAALMAPDGLADETSRPYPFCLAYPLEQGVESLGPRADWQAEWKWDGIRAQLIRRAGHTYLWSRGEEVITARFPEVVSAAAALPDGTVLDGEVLAWDGDGPLPFARLQLRIGRQNLTRQALASAPAAFMAYDLLEDDGRDVRAMPLAERRLRLEALIARHAPGLRLSPIVTEPDWEALGTLRQESRTRGVEGYMLKRLDSAYGTGRRKGDWWKWKVDPFSVDAVLVYAQPGNGRRATLFTDYTFALWKDGELVPVAKAYSGLSNEEIEQVDRWVRANTLEKFGPVRRVTPALVFEVAFENVQRSTRHKSGVAVRFPRIARWRKDKGAQDADHIQALIDLIRAT